MLTRASLRDSGNYTCVPNAAVPASVRVHVLTGNIHIYICINIQIFVIIFLFKTLLSAGEQPAAMQTSGAHVPNAWTAITVFACLIISKVSLCQVLNLAQYILEHRNLR